MGFPMVLEGGSVFEMACWVWKREGEAEGDSKKRHESSRS